MRKNIHGAPAVGGFERSGPNDGQSVSYYLGNNSEQASLVWKDQYRVGFWEQMNRSGSWHRFRADYGQTPSYAKALSGCTKILGFTC